MISGKRIFVDELNYYYETRVVSLTCTFLTLFKTFATNKIKKGIASQFPLADTDDEINYLRSRQTISNSR
jgi:hypothetical protein